MEYIAEIIEVKDLNDYEGFIVLNCNSYKFLAYYQAPYEFAVNYFKNRIIKIDLWLFDGDAQIIQRPLKKLPDSFKVAGGTVWGEVKDVYTSHEFRMDCGCLKLDVRNEATIKLLQNSYIKTTGTFQIFFPNTDYSKENCWD